MIDVKKIYDQRFNSYERLRKVQLWNILVSDFLQQFVKPNDTVVDVGAGHCEFINCITAKTKIALDLNNDVKKFANGDVKILIGPVKQLRKHFIRDSIDVIFMSNLLEHLDSKEEVFRLLKEAYGVLRTGGRLLIMQPDIGLVGHEYWDYFDHKVPITYASLLEVLVADGFKIFSSRYPFLPYTVKTKHLPLWPILLKIYLKLRPLQYVFGKQFFVCAEK
jgi:ubiquinone/menaquinone biosynthesis C-methylase UbiE